MAKVTYHKSHKYVDLNGNEHNFQTQLYAVGVYGILDNRSDAQGNYTPQQIKKIEKSFKKLLDNNEIKSFELGIPITVTDESGLWKKVE